MDFIFERNINYYETDRMGIVHHSNYIRYLEETRCAWLKAYDMPFSFLEANGITIPVLGVNCTFKHHVTFEDVILIKPWIKNFNGVRLTVGYTATNKKTGDIVFTAETQHCFTDITLRPIRLQKTSPELYEKFLSLMP